MGDDTENGSTLKPYLSKTGALALAVGTSIGWGCLVVSNYEYLAQAGPAGSCIGMALGALVMLIVAANFVYMAGACKESDGIYTYVKTAFGYVRNRFGACLRQFSIRKHRVTRKMRTNGLQTPWGRSIIGWIVFG